MLDFMIERLNENSKCHYTTNNAYGYSQLALASPNSAGGISDLSLGNTKKELYYQIRFLLDWLRFEQDKRNHIASCTHRDCFNQYEGKKDISVIHEYNGKFHCSACRRDDLTKEDFEKSKIPVTWEEARKVFD